HTTHVHAHYLIPELDRRLVHRADTTDPGVVEQHVDASVALGGIFGERGARFGIGHVDDERRRHSAGVADLRDGVVRGGEVDVGDDDATALAREQQRRRPADAGTRAGDDTDLLG